MGKISFLVVVSFVVLALVPVWGSTWYVDNSVGSSGDGATWKTAFKTIQEGINAASGGDTIIVAEGMYAENIQFNGKNVVLTSTDPLDPSVVANTIIDGNKAGSVVTFSGTENETCVLSGFTIRNGSGVPTAMPWVDIRATGGGVCGGTWERRTLAAVGHNVIVQNSAEYGGGLAYCDGMILNNTITENSKPYALAGGGGLWDCDGTIQGNRISANHAGGGGGLCDCDGTIQNNIIDRNSAGMDGGGLANCDGTVQNNTIAGNSAGRYGAGLYQCDGALRNSVVWGNRTDAGGAQLYLCSRPTHCCIEGSNEGGKGNITTDPLFVDGPGGAYHLRGSSPCIDAGVNFYWFPWPQRDFAGNCRLHGPRVDMGCFEHGSSPDSDGDLLPDAQEVARLTDPQVGDTDGDGLCDGLEVLRSSSPQTPTRPSVLHVPGTFPRIQEALCLAVSGDEIIVAPGTYFENLQFSGADVVLRSSDPSDPAVVAGTVIDGEGAGSVIRLTGGETESCVISGFTIRNGRASAGAGICGGTYFQPTRALIERNTITANVSIWAGGGWSGRLRRHNPGKHN
ncbi:MAG: right-handed parallel beta-helix repeat-containing protein [bacterium]|nr:right-handed parallel beta-helix repeat-containing protein [bacterium]